MKVRIIVSSLSAVALLGFLPAPATAVPPGPNGPIAFVSGRDGGDAQSDVYIIDNPGAQPRKLTSAVGQHRHPAWSPDRTKIAYALWNPDNGGDDIWIHDVRFGSRSRLTADAAQDDRPVWSPDGTKIAYESRVGAQNRWDIKIANATALGGNTATNLTNTVNDDETKPAWAPDGNIFYALHPGGAAPDIFKKPANNPAAVGTPVVTGVAGEFQPALSPDGSKLCFTRGSFSNDADVIVVSSTGQGAQDDISDNPTTADYNCAWSPDGTKILFATGLLSAGNLRMTNSNGSGSPITIQAALEPVFDGNPDWAVGELCRGREATQIGTAGGDTLVGTLADDVIAGLGGGDVIKGLQGDDIVCGGPGRDTIAGGGGNDRLFGEGGKDLIKGGAGNDRLNGGPGRDRCIGGAGTDKAKACESLKSIP